MTKETILTEAEEARRGALLAQMLNLKRSPEKDRWLTQWGTKTDLGLYRSIKRIINAE